MTSITTHSELIAPTSQFSPHIINPHIVTIPHLIWPQRLPTDWSILIPSTASFTPCRLGKENVATNFSTFPSFTHRLTSLWHQFGYNLYHYNIPILFTHSTNHIIWSNQHGHFLHIWHSPSSLHIYPCLVPLPWCVGILSLQLPLWNTPTTLPILTFPIHTIFPIYLPSNLIINTIYIVIISTHVTINVFVMITIDYIVISRPHTSTQLT